jgi:predicted metal-dependent HD superfamily phosphohydrolase
MSTASRERFRRLFQPPADAVFDDIETANAGPARRYHTLEHIGECLTQLDGVVRPEAARRRIELALWWHDAVYDPTRSDNEAQSAGLARGHLRGLGEPEDEIDEVARLIALTAGHTVASGDQVGATLVSIDLAILGQSQAVYDRYAAQVRAEYAHVPDSAFRAGRAQVLARFLETPAIYADPEFRDRLEAAARANIAREIAALTTMV